MKCCFRDAFEVLLLIVLVFGTSLVSGQDIQLADMDGVYSFQEVVSDDYTLTILGYYVLMLRTEQVPDVTFDACLDINYRMEFRLHADLLGQGQVGITLTDVVDSAPPGVIRNNGKIPIRVAQSNPNQNAKKLERLLRDVFNTASVMEFMGDELFVFGDEATLKLKREDAI